MMVLNNLYHSTKLRSALCLYILLCGNLVVVVGTFRHVGLPAVELVFIMLKPMFLYYFSDSSVIFKDPTKIMLN